MLAVRARGNAFQAQAGKTDPRGLSDAGSPSTRSRVVDYSTEGWTAASEERDDPGAAAADDIEDPRELITDGVP